MYFPVLSFRFPIVFGRFPIELFRSRYSVIPISFSRRAFPFPIPFPVQKCGCGNGLEIFPTVPDRFHPYLEPRPAGVDLDLERGAVGWAALKPFSLVRRIEQCFNLVPPFLMWGSWVGSFCGCAWRRSSAGVCRRGGCSQNRSRPLVDGLVSNGPWMLRG